jgi:hypothetical protein
MSKTKMLFFAAATIATISCRSFDCSGPAGCGGSTASAPKPKVTTSSDTLDNYFFMSAFKQLKKRRSAEAGAEPQFFQNFASGSSSQSFDCTGPTGCAGLNVPSPTFNTQNIQTPSANFFQQFLAGSSATNIANGGKKKRSTEPDADPGFHQTFQSGSQTQNFDCTGTNGCYPVITGNYPSIHHQANRNSPSNYDYVYYDYDQANRNNSRDHNQANGNVGHNSGTSYPSHHDQANRNNPGFDQTYKAGSQYENIDSSGSTTGKITVTGGGHNSDVSHSGINSNENVMGQENPCWFNGEFQCGINERCISQTKWNQIHCECLPGFRRMVDSNEGCLAVSTKNEHFKPSPTHPVA